jgi:hypothetical protein
MSVEHCCPQGILKHFVGNLGGSTVHGIGGNVLPRKVFFFLASLTLLCNMTIKYPQDRTADLIVWVAVVYTCGKYTWSPFLLTS